MPGEDHLKLDEGIKGYLCFSYCSVAALATWPAPAETSRCLMKADSGGRDVRSSTASWDFRCDHTDCETCSYSEGDVARNRSSSPHPSLHDTKRHRWSENDNCGESTSDSLVNSTPSLRRLSSQVPHSSNPITTTLCSPRMVVEMGKFRDRTLKGGELFHYADIEEIDPVIQIKGKAR